jgi:GrpE protein
MSTELLARLRQYRYPKIFRINAYAEVPGIADITQTLEVIAKELAAEPTVASTADTDNEAFYTQLATFAWRVQQTCEREGNEHINRHVTKIIDTLAGQGITLLVKTGEPYDPGMSMQVLSSEPTQGISRAVIKETIQPTVLLHGRVLQKAQVVIGVPSAEVEQNS